MIESFHKASTFQWVLGGCYIFGRIVGEPSKRLHLLIGAILKGKWAIEHVAEGDRPKKQTVSFHVDLEIGVRVVVYPNSTSRLESLSEAKCCLINIVNSRRKCANACHPVTHYRWRGQSGSRVVCQKQMRVWRHTRTHCWSWSHARFTTLGSHTA